MGHDQVWRIQLEQCVQTHGRLLYHLAWNVLRDSQAAEDVCQQALLKACSHLSDGRDSQTMRNWLARTVVNEAIGELRRRTRQDRLLRAQFAGRPDRTAEQPDEVLRETVYLGLEQLEDETRDVVIMRIMQGRSGKEVARLLDISDATVSRRLHEGMSRLRHCMNMETNAAPARGVP